MKRRPAAASSVFALADDVKAASRTLRRNAPRFVTGVDIDAIHHKRGAIRVPPPKGKT